MALSTNAAILLSQMTRWQHRWEANNGPYGGWRPICNIVAANRGERKAVWKPALVELADAGLILRKQFANGEFWCGIDGADLALVGRAA